MKLGGGVWEEGGGKTNRGRGGTTGFRWLQAQGREEGETDAVTFFHPLLVQQGSQEFRLQNRNCKLSSSMCPIEAFKCVLDIVIWTRKLSDMMVIWWNMIGDDVCNWVLGDGKGYPNANCNLILAQQIRQRRGRGSLYEFAVCTMYTMYNV